MIRFSWVRIQIRIGNADRDPGAIKEIGKNDQINLNSKAFMKDFVAICRYDFCQSPYIKYIFHVKIQICWLPGSGSGYTLRQKARSEFALKPIRIHKTAKKVKVSVYMKVRGNTVIKSDNPLIFLMYYMHSFISLSFPNFSQSYPVKGQTILKDYIFKI
jgi:hypothetical protein